MYNAWHKAQNWEASWWHTCVNTFDEELKQRVYAREMDLSFEPGSNGSYINMGDKSILDVGGGPVSLLLKTKTLGSRKVIDPALYPQWTLERYRLAGISFEQIPAEKMDEAGYDEVWMYNVLEHVNNPEEICKRVLAAGKMIRVFEWINTRTNLAHPQTFTKERLESMLIKNPEDAVVSVKRFDGENGCKGEAWTALIYQESENRGV